MTITDGLLAFLNLSGLVDVFLSEVTLGFVSALTTKHAVNTHTSILCFSKNG